LLSKIIGKEIEVIVLEKYLSDQTASVTCRYEDFDVLLCQSP